MFIPCSAILCIVESRINTENSILIIFCFYPGFQSDHIVQVEIDMENSNSGSCTFFAHSCCCQYVDDVSVILMAGFLLIHVVCLDQFPQLIITRCQFPRALSILHVMCHSSWVDIQGFKPLVMSYRLVCRVHDAEKVL